MIQIKVFVLFLIIFISSILLTNPIIEKYNIVLIEPNFGEYNSDELSFLKIFYLIENGSNYYEAFKLARSNFLGGTNLIQNDTFTWRLPTVYYIWNIFSNSGKDILTLYIFLLLIFIFCVFLISKKITSNNYISLFSVFVLIPYFMDTFRYKTSFLFTEWWALFFYTYGLTALIYNKTILSLFLFIFALFIRELYIIPILFLAMFNFKINRKFIYWIIIFAIYSIFIYIHSYFVSTMFDSINNQNTFFSRLHSYSIINLQHMASFSMRYYIIYGLKSHYILFLMGIVALLSQLYFNSKASKYLFITIISSIVVLPIISVKENDYWGILFMPFVIMSLPMILNIKNIKRE